jgi:hypothetical protein
MKRRVLADRSYFKGHYELIACPQLDGNVHFKCLVRVRGTSLKASHYRHVPDRNRHVWRWVFEVGFRKEIRREARLAEKRVKNRILNDQRDRSA